MKRKWRWTGPGPREKEEGRGLEGREEEGRREEKKVEMGEERRKRDVFKEHQTNLSRISTGRTEYIITTN